MTLSAASLYPVELALLESLLYFLCSVLPDFAPPLLASPLPSNILNLASTLDRPSIPTAASSPSPKASTRMAKLAFAAKTREILPLNLGAACPIKLA